MQWFRWRDCIHSTPTWAEFTTALCQEFGPSDFEDCTESLFKLKQTGTLKDYILEFRRLANRTTDVGPILLKSCFIGGLKRDLKYDVKLLKPTSVHDAIALAVQIDAKLMDLKIMSHKHVPPARLNSLPPPIPGRNRVLPCL